MSALFQPKFLLEVLKDTAEMHHMSLRRPITGGRQPDIEGKNEAQAPVLSPKILGESVRTVASSPSSPGHLPLICEANRDLIS